MTITICSSMSHYKEIKKVEKELQSMNHIVLIPHTTNFHFEEPDRIFNEDFKFCKKNDVLMDHYEKIEKSDAILVLNYNKNGLKNYIGGAVLGEMAVSYYLGKNIFLMNKIPSEKDIRYAFEIKLMQPTMLNGDLSKINSSPRG